MSASHRHGAEGLAKRASYPTRQLITPRYAPTTGSGVRAVRCGLSELTQRGGVRPMQTSLYKDNDTVPYAAQS